MCRTAKAAAAEQLRKELRLQPLLEVAERALWWLKRSKLFSCLLHGQGSECSEPKE